MTVTAVYSDPNLFLNVHHFRAKECLGMWYNSGISVITKYCTSERTTKCSSTDPPKNRVRNKELEAPAANDKEQGKCLFVKETQERGLYSFFVDKLYS